MTLAYQCVGDDRAPHIRARYYDPGAGHFLAEDPLRFDGGSDFYGYVSNNPIVFADPIGLKKTCLTEIMLVTAYCDSGPGTDWKHFKPGKKGQKPRSVGPGTVAVANSDPQPYPFGCSVTVFNSSINTQNVGSAGSKDVITKAKSTTRARSGMQGTTTYCPVNGSIYGRAPAAKHAPLVPSIEW